MESFLEGGGWGGHLFYHWDGGKWETGNGFPKHFWLYAGCTAHPKFDVEGKWVNNENTNDLEKYILYWHDHSQHSADLGFDSYADVREVSLGDEPGFVRGTADSAYFNWAAVAAIGREFQFTVIFDGSGFSIQGNTEGGHSFAGTVEPEDLSASGAGGSW